MSACLTVPFVEEDRKYRLTGVGRLGDSSSLSHLLYNSTTQENNPEAASETCYYLNDSLIRRPGSRANLEGVDPGERRGREAQRSAFKFPSELILLSAQPSSTGKKD